MLQQETTLEKITRVIYKMAYSLSGCLVQVAIATLSTVLTAVTICLLWNWFIAEWFHIRSLVPVVAYGISLLFTFLVTVAKTPTEDEAQKKSVNIAAYQIDVSIVFIVLGYIVHLFMSV